jgi:hypothetical protein
MERGGIYTGFEAFKIPSVSETQSALKTSILAVDTNVLLNLYRYNKSTVADILKILEAARNQLFVPHQVVREFWRNRQTVISNLGAATKDVNAALKKNESSTEDAITRWAKSVALPHDQVDGLVAEVKEFFAKVQLTVGNEPSRVSAQLPTSEDELLQRLASLLDGAVGPKLSEDEWKDAVAEGERRVEHSEPPGYMDVDKLESDLPEGAAGDYIVWLQLLQEGARSKKDLVLITADTKEDWWNRTDRGRLVGPRHELVDEYRRETACQFYLMEPADLLKHSAVFGVGTSEESVQDVERVQKEPVDHAPWTLDAVRAVLAELAGQGHSQADVIREAAQNGGRISRQRVYEIDGRDEAQMLRGFTRPVKRITGELQDRGLVPFGVPPLLDAVYESGVKSSHFAVPSEVTDLLHEQQES